MLDLFPFQPLGDDIAGCAVLRSFAQVFERSRVVTLRLGRDSQVDRGLWNLPDQALELGSFFSVELGGVPAHGQIVSIARPVRVRTSVSNDAFGNPRLLLL